VTTRRNRKGALLSKSAYGGVRSALMYLHKVAGYETPDDFKRDMSQFNRGIKRQVAEEKQASGMSLEEGKKAMSFDVYKLMCQKLMASEADDAVFTHLFLVLGWNLMVRSDSCAQLKMGHVEWRGDCLAVFLAKSKGDQTGEKSDHPWHVYSNPFEPELCPVLAMAKYLCSNPDIIQNGALFPGNNQYDRFIKSFHHVINENVDEFKALGIEPRDLGSHSCRKGAITLVSSGCPVPPPPTASVCLRAGWSLGTVKDCYIFCEKAGNQFTGRSVSGISWLTKEFVTSPVY